MKKDYRRSPMWLVIFLAPIISLGMGIWAIRGSTILNGFMTLGNLVVIMVASLGQYRFAAKAPERRSPIVPAKRRRVEGVWIDAPIAEIDKSTFGKLLASRLRREPGLRVVVRGRTAEPHPASSDSLYDPELDG